MIAFTPAKINIGLFVTGRRHDGYHDLESLFIPIPWKDALEIQLQEEPGIQLTTSGLPIPGAPEDNLIVKAYNLVTRTHELPGVKACVVKNIPLGAGLGGGSSNGAHMLRLLKESCSVNATPEQWNQWAAALGSDCPFFMQDEAAMTYGRGEHIEPNPSILTHLRGWNIAILHPGVHVSTREAFAAITPSSPPFDLKELTLHPVEDWKHRVHNDFEGLIRKKHSAVDQAVVRLQEAGASYVQMTGTGSAVFGLFSDETSAAKIAHWGAKKGWRTHCSSF
jgi:4-diphosphocytidyl-2-C-methyl-D-erythritol kinase